MTKPTDSPLLIERVERRDFGYGYRLLTAKDRLPVFAADSLLYDPYEDIVRRKLGVSLCSGCSVGCRFCFTNRIRCFRRLTAEEIAGQTAVLMDNSDWLDGRRYQQLKIAFKQMGDPLVNPGRTLQALKRLGQIWPAAQYVVSTAGPAQHHDWFLRRLSALADSGQDIRLQFSCHTTVDRERRELCPKLTMLPFLRLGEIAANWPHGRVTLNIVVMKGMTYSAARLADHFRPEDVFIKVNYIDSNRDTRELGIETDTEKAVTTFEDGLAGHGFSFARRLTRKNYL